MRLNQNENLGSSFKEHLYNALRIDNHSVYQHIKEAIRQPHLKLNGDYQYLLEAIKDVAIARGYARKDQTDSNTSS